MKFEPSLNWIFAYSFKVKGSFLCISFMQDVDVLHALLFPALIIISA